MQSHSGKKPRLSNNNREMFTCNLDSRKRGEEVEVEQSLPRPEPAPDKALVLLSTGEGSGDNLRRCRMYLEPSGDRGPPLQAGTYVLTDNDHANAEVGLKSPHPKGSAQNMQRKPHELKATTRAPTVLENCNRYNCRHTIKVVIHLTTGNCCQTTNETGHLVVG